MELTCTSCDQSLSASCYTLMVMSLCGDGSFMMIMMMMFIKMIMMLLMTMMMMFDVDDDDT